MNWTEKSAVLFSKAMEDFNPQGLTRRSHVANHLDSKGKPKLALKFLEFAKNVTEISSAIQSAKDRRLCLFCNGSFLFKDRSVCRTCLSTEEGRFYSKRLRLAGTANYFQTNFGVSSCFGTKETQKKIAVILGQRFEGGHPLRDPEVMLRLKRTCKNRYGGHPMSNSYVKARLRKTSLERFGVKNPFQSEKVKNKIRETNLERYGVANPMQNSEVRKRATASANRLTPIKCKGKTFLCQGYEKHVLPRLVNRFGVENVVGQFEEDFKPLKFKGRVYTPDFYIRSNDTYVEVKSSFTLYGKIGVSNFLRQNRSLQEQASNRGIKLKFIVYNEVKDKCTVLPTAWTDLSRTCLKQNLS
jgi:hypothetical protein